MCKYLVHSLRFIEEKPLVESGGSVNVFDFVFKNIQFFKFRKENRPKKGILFCLLMPCVSLNNKQ